MDDVLLYQNVREWILNNEMQILTLVKQLVRFNTVNQVVTGTEKECQLFVAEVLRQLEMEVDVFTPEDVQGLREHEAYYPGKDYSDRPNVVGVRKGVGQGKSLIFSSHADTAVAGTGWESDPWSPMIENGRLYGLGTFDMKGGLAASIMAVRCIQELGIQLRGDLLIESVVDEEFGGANGTLASRLRGYNPDAAIIPEPTNLAICPANRGGALWRVTFRGNTGLSFSGETIINPANLAAKFIAYLEEYEQERSQKIGPAPWYQKKEQIPVIVTRLAAGDLDSLLCDSGPTECDVDIWVECHPNVTEEELKQNILDGFQKKVGDPYRVWGEPTFRKMIRFLPGSQVEPDFPLIGLLTETAGQVLNRQVDITGAPFACDAFIFNLYSPTPAIIMGPMGANAHAPGEYIDIPSLLQLTEIYVRTILEWCGYVQEERGSNEKSSGIRLGSPQEVI